MTEIFGNLERKKSPGQVAQDSFCLGERKGKGSICRCCFMSYDCMEGTYNFMMQTSSRNQRLNAPSSPSPENLNLVEEVAPFTMNRKFEKLL